MTGEDTSLFEVASPRSRFAAVEVHSVDCANGRVRMGPHAHRDLELLYFQSGSGMQLFSGREWPVDAGVVVLIPPDVIHDLSIAIDAVGWAVEFAPTALEGMSGVGQSLQLWRSNPLLNVFLAAEAQAEAGIFRVAESDRPRWEGILQGLDREQLGDRRGADQAVRAYLLLLLVEVARLTGDVESELRCRHEPVLADTFALIESHFAEDLSTRDVAEAVGMSPGHLTTLVRQRTGKTVLDWITERRMTEARVLLSGTDLPADIIARRVGFRDPRYFSRRFRQIHGKPPGIWRK